MKDSARGRANPWISSSQFAQPRGATASTNRRVASRASPTIATATGTFFPISGLPEWAQVLANFNPLYHCVQLVRDAAFGLGWIGFDPANQCCPDERYVRLGSGLDASDAAPIRGIAAGQGIETMDVAVNVEEVERFQTQSQSQTQS